MQGLRKAPNAVYALVQTALVQDEALKRANAASRNWRAARPNSNQSGGFLDSMRDAIFGQNQPQARLGAERPRARGGRPPGMEQRPGDAADQSRTSPDNMARGHGQHGQPYGAPQPPMGGGGGSFLGTAAAAAAGVVGGSLLLGSIRSMMGGGHHQGFGDPRALAAALKTAGRGAISPAAIWRATPASTTSARAEIRARALDANDDVRAPDSSIQRRTTTITTTWIMIPTASTATATAITPERISAGS
jgi:hypothetical protein